MVYFTIAGKPDCHNYVHVSHVADYLEKHLPNFSVKRIELPQEEWDQWLRQINRENHWHHSTSPLVYKELMFYGSAPHLIGGISEFWEYCNDYYRLNSILPEDELKALVEENIRFFESNHLESKNKSVRNILIYGASEPIVYLLVTELLAAKEICGTKGIKFLLYDEAYTENEKNMFDDIKLFLTDQACQVVILEEISYGLGDCDLIIITENRSRKDYQPKSCRKLIMKMSLLADEINHSAKESLKVVFANSGQTCIAATILLKMCKKTTKNVVVVSSNLGLEALNVISKTLDINLNKLGGPPVWGFLGLNEIIDLNCIVQKCNVYKPYLRAINSTDNSSLVRGTMLTELRLLEYLINDVVIDLKVKERRELIESKLGAPTMFARVSATINLLKIWYSSDTNQIISLGIRSDGSFGISKGLVFSQPAILQNDSWVPFSGYPVSMQMKPNIAEAVLEAEETLKKF